MSDPTTQPESEYDIPTRLYDLAEKYPDDAVLLRAAADEIRRLTPERRTGRRSEPTTGAEGRFRTFEVLPPEE